MSGRAGGRAFRRPDRRRRHLRRRRRLSPDARSARARSFVVLEAQDELRRHLAARTDIPGIRSDSDLYTFGYRFKPWIGTPIATADEILQLHGRGDRRERPRAATSATATGSSRASWSSDDNLLDHRGRRAPTPARRVRFTAELPVDVPGLLPPRRGLHARMAGHGPTSRAGSSTRRPGPRTSTTRASGSS